MNIKVKQTLLFFILILLQTNPIKAQEQSEYQFPFPSIPSELQTPTERANYLIEHYWDHFNFTDPNLENKKDNIEQAWVDFIDILSIPIITLDKSQTAIEQAFQQAEINPFAFRTFASLADKYLYSLHSTYKNEELYIFALQSILNASILTPIEKEKPKHQLRIAQNNRVGTVANDIQFTTTLGSSSLHAIDSPLTLLFIHDFDCHTCQLELDEIRNSTILQQQIQNKQLAVLTIYPYDEITEWKNRQNTYDTLWINGYDTNQEIIEKDTYSLRASSSFYLFDSDKKIILKDSSVEIIENYLDGL